MKTIDYLLIAGFIIFIIWIIGKWFYDKLKKR